MKSKDKNIVYFLTICIDIFLIGLLLFHKIKTKFDFIYILLILFTHCIFLYSIYYNITNLIDLTHICIPISICISVFLDSFYLKFINLLLLIFIQISWYFFDGCIISYSFSKGNILIPYWMALLWTLVLIYNLYHPLT